MPKKRMFPIDPARLNDALAARKLTPQMVSRKLGYCNIYIKQTMDRRKISEACMTALDAVYGIKYADYKVLPPPEPVKEEKAEPQPIDELFKCVYLAVYKGFQKALKEDSGGESD